MGCQATAYSQPPVTAYSPPLTPNLQAFDSTNASVTWGNYSVWNGPVCSTPAGLEQFCIGNLYDALGNGLGDVLGHYMTPAATGPSDYQADFSVIEFSHGQGSAVGSVQAALKWQFALRDATGNTVVNVAETTVGPEFPANAGEGGVQKLLNAVLERIGTELQTYFVAIAAKAEPEPPSEPEPPTCVPGSTQQCFGPGGCQGAQICQPDGKTFGPCDCGDSESSPEPPPEEPGALTNNDLPSKRD